MKKILMLSALVVFIFTGCKTSEKVATTQTSPSDATHISATATVRATPASTPTTIPTSTATFELEDYSKYNLIGNIKTIKHTKWKFSMDYPAEWTAQLDGDSDNDGGATVLIKGGNKDTDYIGVSAQPGTLLAPPSFRETGTLFTKDGTKTTLFYDDRFDDRVVITILFDYVRPSPYYHNYMAVAVVTKPIFKKNKEQIIGVLRNIRIEPKK